MNAELNVQGLGHPDMLSYFMYVHACGGIGAKDTIWKSKRFDHVFASSSLRPSHCYYESIIVATTRRLSSVLTQLVAPPNIGTMLRSHFDDI